MGSILTENDIFIEMAYFTNSSVGDHNVRWLSFKDGLCKVEQLDG